MSTPSIVWNASVFSPDGYADEARCFLAALEAAGTQPLVASMPSSAPALPLAPQEQQRLDLQVQRGERWQQAHDRPAVVVNHYVPYAEMCGVTPNALHVARTMFETDRLPAGWRELLVERTEEIWVPSHWGAEVFARCGIPEERIRVLGETINFDLYDPETTQPYALEDVPAEHTVFLSNFDFSERKGWRQLLRAWGRAFAPDSGVCLLLKVHSLYRDQQFVQQRIEAFLAAEFGQHWERQLAPIRVFDRMLSTADLARLYRAADAYVLPSRGEGWGRPYMEALAMGLPTVASAWSGQTEFMRPEHSWLLPGQLVRVQEDAEVFNQLYQGHRWFEVDEEALAAALQEIAHDLPAARAKAAPARQDLLERFGPQPLAARTLELAHQLWERCGWRAGRSAQVSWSGRWDGTPAGLLDRQLGGQLDAQGVLTRSRVEDLQLRSAQAVGVQHRWPLRIEPSTLGPQVFFLGGPGTPLSRDTYRRLREAADLVLVPTTTARSQALEGGLGDRQVAVLPPPAPPQERRQPVGAVRYLFLGEREDPGLPAVLAAWPTNPTASQLHVALLEARDPEQDDPQELELLLGGRAGVSWSQPRGMSELREALQAADVLVAWGSSDGWWSPCGMALGAGLAVLVPAKSAGAEICGPAAVTAPDLAALTELLAREPQRDFWRPYQQAAHTQATASNEQVQTALAQLGALVRDPLPPVGQLEPMPVPEARAQVVVYAPDWHADDWPVVLERWCAAVGDDTPLTLALFCADATAAQQAEELLTDWAASRPVDADLTLLIGQLPDIVLAADGLLDGEQLPEARLARRLLDSRQLSAFVPQPLPAR